MSSQRNWDTQNFYQLTALAAFLGLQDNGLQAGAFGTCPVNLPMQVVIPGRLQSQIYGDRHK